MRADEAGSSFGQSGVQMLGLKAVKSEIPQDCVVGPLADVMFYIRTVRRIYMGSIF
jgi:hypothetical protein